ncbi:MAG TPA: substrate-binding domain-containing protein [Longimicrobiales bacterium]|nr:substrate-binding domain-containing protein [Longimicrobiales bacterium]
MTRRAVLALLLALVTLACEAGGERRRLVLGSTHTLDDSGMLEVIADAFSAAHPRYSLSVVVAGSGEVLAMATNGDLDVLLTHSPDDEAAFIASGRGIARHAVMYNDFVLLGPLADPARADSAADAADALHRIQQQAAPFISRGDDSGTHRKELELWAAAGTVPEWDGYVQAGTGMADALRLADQRAAYTLTDRATWEVLRDGLPALRIVHEDDPRLHNQYSVITVEGAAEVDGARAFADWIRGPAAQDLINGFGADRAGRPLFNPNAQ